MVSQNRLFSMLCWYVTTNVLTYEEYHSMGIEGFHKWVRENYAPIPKSELEVGKKYKGYGSPMSEAIWNGEHFTWVDNKYNHYEDYSDTYGLEIFVPIKEVNHE